jgi:hypothetical protein
MRSTCLLDYAVHGLNTQLAFDLLGESHTASRNGFRPASTFREFPNFVFPRFVTLNDLNDWNGAQRWNVWNWLRF